MQAKTEKSHERAIGQKQTSVSLPEDLWKAGIAAASKQEMKFSQLVRLALKEKLARLAAQEYANPQSTIAMVNEPPFSNPRLQRGPRQNPRLCKG